MLGGSPSSDTRGPGLRESRISHAHLLMHSCYLHTIQHAYEDSTGACDAPACAVSAFAAAAPGCTIFTSTTVSTAIAALRAQGAAQHGRY